MTKSFPFQPEAPLDRLFEGEDKVLNSLSMFLIYLLFHLVFLNLIPSESKLGGQDWEESEEWEKRQGKDESSDLTDIFMISGHYRYLIKVNFFTWALWWVFWNFSEDCLFLKLLWHGQRLSLVKPTFTIENFLLDGHSTSFFQWMFPRQYFWGGSHLK